jgi:dolichol kinase
MFGLDSINPVTQNLLATVGTVIYVKGVIALCDVGVSTIKVLPSDISRKIIHIAAGSWIVWWRVYNDNHWTWMLNVTVPFIYTFTLFLKGAIIKDRNDPDVLTMSRTGDPSELLYGPIHFTVVATIVGLSLYKESLGVMILAALAYGDGVAPLIGQRYPIYPYKTIIGNNSKTLSGSIAFFISTIIGTFVFYHVLELPQYGMNEILIFSFVSTIAEGLFPCDNITIPISILLTSKFIL